MAGGGLLAAQLVHAEGLPGAHLGHHPQLGVLPLVVDLGADAVDQVVLLLPGIVGAEGAVLGIGLQQQLRQQRGRRLQHLFPSRV